MSDEYGILRGANTAYEAYRGREREIEDKGRRALVDKRIEDKNARDTEEYEYGVSRRSAQEQAQTTQQQAADLALKSGTATFQEWTKNTAQRAEQNLLSLEKAKKDLKVSGLQYDDAALTLKAKQGTEKYNQWTNEWLQGEDIESLTKKFNTDDDDTNNIAATTGNETQGWEVTFENGRKMKFADRDAVAIHLQSMADPNFHQTYLLQMKAQEASLAQAVQKSATKTADTLSKEKTTWENMTRAQVKDYFTESIKESIVSLGSEGSRDMAGDVRAVVDSIGAAGAYGLVNSNVTRVANQMAKTMLVKEPAERKRAAEEYLEKLRDKGGALPEEGTPEYAEIVNRQMATDYDRDYDDYKRAVYSKFFHENENGTLGMKDPRTIADYARRETDQGAAEDTGDSISSEGLTRDDVAPEQASIPDNLAGAVDGTGEPGLPERPNRAEAVAPQESSDNATFVPTASSLVSQKREEYGLKKTGRGKGRISKAQKRKIMNDFDQTFADMNRRSQGAWFKEFGRYLTESAKDRAKEILGKA